jgi:hypothetical protein
MWLWVCHCLSQFILKFQAYILISGAIFKMENNFYTTTLSIIEGKNPEWLDDML